MADVANQNDLTTTSPAGEPGSTVSEPSLASRLGLGDVQEDEPADAGLGARLGLVDPEEESSDSSEGADDTGGEEADEAATEPDDESGAESEAGDETTAAEPPAVPEKLTVGEAEVATADVVAGYSQLQELQTLAAELKSPLDIKGVLQLGVDYGHAMQRFDQSAAGAEETISSLVGAAIARYGKEIALEPVKLADLDPAKMEPLERQLYSVAYHAMGHAAGVETDNAELARQLREAQAKITQFENAEDQAKILRATHPDAELSGWEVLQLMRKHGVDDPVKAYRLETFGKKPAAAGAGKAAESAESTTPAQKKPKAPAGGSAVPEFDATNLSAKEIEARLAKGWKPK